MTQRDRTEPTLARDTCAARGIDFDNPDDFSFWSEYDRKARIIDSFHYHQPTQGQIDRIAAVRRGAIAFAELIMRMTENSADQTHALRTVHEAMMTANKSIVCEQKAG
jgi:hypothetical protein